LTEPAEGARDYCRTTVRRGDRDRYLTALFAPASRRDDLLVLAAFNLEIARAREQVREPMLGLIRLQWWREALDAIFSGSVVRKHPVAEALADAIGQYGLPREPFDRMIAARERDMEAVPSPDMAALETYARETSAPLFLLMAIVLIGAPKADADVNTAALTDAGTGYALTGLLRALPFHAASARVYLPRDRVEAASLTEQDLAHRGPSTARAAIVKEIARNARVFLDRARPAFKSMPRDAAPLRLSCALARWHLDRLAAAGYEPHAAGVQSTPPWMGWQLGWWRLTGRS
jgi:phytoene synthase